WNLLNGVRAVFNLGRGSLALCGVEGNGADRNDFSVEFHCSGHLAALRASCHPEQECQGENRKAAKHSFRYGGHQFLLQGGEKMGRQLPWVGPTQRQKARTPRVGRGPRPRPTLRGEPLGSSPVPVARDPNSVKGYRSLPKMSPEPGVLAAYQDDELT